MSEIAWDSGLGKRICDALEVEHVRAITISLAVGAIASVTVSYYPDKEHLEKLIPILEEYKLVKKEVNGGKNGKL